MVTDAVIDTDAARLFYLAFDLLLAQAPIRDGAVQMDESHLVRRVDDDPATSAHHAAVRAALFGPLGSGFETEREAEITRAADLAAGAGLELPPAIPDDQVQKVTLNRKGPTPLP
jgi:hypothetical protein